MADVEFINLSAEVKKALVSAANKILEGAALLIESQAKENTMVDKNQLRDSWSHVVDESKGEAVIGSPLENAIWEEFGTGEYALKRNGKSKPWYVPVEGYTGKKKPSYNGKVVIVYGKNGKAYYKTNGKKPRRALHNAFETKRPAVIRMAEEIMKSEMEK